MRKKPKLESILLPEDATGEKKAGAWIVEAYARKLEEEIRASPADWLWVHNKWKYPKPAPAEL